MPPSDLIWRLIGSGRTDALIALNPSDFDWGSLHPKERVTPLQWALNGLADPSRKQKRSNEEVFKLLAWLLERGADPAQESPGCRGGMSPMLFVAEAMDTCEEDPNAVNALAQILNLFATASKAKPTVTLPVSISVIELWERIQSASSTHDITFQTADGDVTAHSIVIAQASPVLSAMLSSDMREARQKRIEIRDVSSMSLGFFLSLLYTGSSSADVDAPVALSALDLAHRWQVGGVVTMIAGALEGMLADTNFSAIAESAALKGLADLRTSCVRFAANSKHVKKCLKESSLPQAVMELLGKPPTPQPEQAAKKRRTF